MKIYENKLSKLNEKEKQTLEILGRKILRKTPGIAGRKFVEDPIKKTEGLI